MISEVKTPKLDKWMVSRAAHLTGWPELAEMFWILTANVSDGDWTQQSVEWQVAVEAVRYAYTEALDTPQRDRVPVQSHGGRMPCVGCQRPLEACPSDPLALPGNFWKGTCPYCGAFNIVGDLTSPAPGAP